MHYMDANKTNGEIAWQQLHKNAASNIGGSTQQSSSCTATYHPARKLSKLDETDVRGHCWRSRDELISDIFLWIPWHEQAKAGQPAWTYVEQFCADTGCRLEDLSEAMDDRDG